MTTKAVGYWQATCNYHRVSWSGSKCRKSIPVLGDSEIELDLALRLAKFWCLQSCHCKKQKHHLKVDLPDRYSEALLGNDVLDVMKDLCPDIPAEVLRDDQLTASTNSDDDSTDDKGDSGGDAGSGPRGRGRAGMPGSRRRGRGKGRGAAVRAAPKAKRGPRAKPKPSVAPASGSEASLPAAASGSRGSESPGSSIDTEELLRNIPSLPSSSSNSSSSS
jgi:hypothetical protein